MEGSNILCRGEWRGEEGNRVGSSKDVEAISEEQGRWRNPCARQVGWENCIDSTQEPKVIDKQGPSLGAVFPKQQSAGHG